MKPAQRPDVDATARAIDYVIAQWHWSGRVAACLDAIDAPAMSKDEMAAYNSLRAAEMARAGRRREPVPQLELGDGRNG